MIEFNKVSHSYRIKSGWNHVLNDLSFQLHKGEKLGVIGKNGTGKSTLLRLISGVEVPKEGDVVRRMSVSGHWHWRSISRVFVRARQHKIYL